MGGFICNCNNVIKTNEIPNPSEWLLISDVTYDNYLPEIPNGVSQSVPQMKNNINELNVNNIQPETIAAASNKSKLPKEVLESIANFNRFQNLFFLYYSFTNCTLSLY